MAYAIVAGVIVLDQILKIAVNKSIALGSSVIVIPKILALTNVHNMGAAWGSFSGYRILLIIIASLCTAGLAVFYFRMRTQLTIRGKIIIALIVGGALGNLIDRIVFGYVRDMIEVMFIVFPVFNIADCAITIGSVLLVIDTLFFDKTSMLSLLEKKPNRKTGEKE